MTAEFFHWYLLQFEKCSKIQFWRNFQSFHNALDNQLGLLRWRLARKIQHQLKIQLFFCRFAIFMPTIVLVFFSHLMILCSFKKTKHNNHARYPGRNSSSFSKEVRKTSIDGNSKTQIPETCLHSGKSKVSRFSWWTSKTGQTRIRNGCLCHHRTIHICRNPPHLKKSIKQANLENGTYEQIVTHLGKEIELNGLEAPDEQQINIVSQHATNIKADRHKPTCHHCKKPGHYRNQCRLLKKQREQTENTQNNPGNRSSDANNSLQDNNTNNNNHINYKHCNRAERKPETVYPPSETCGKTNHSTERCYVRANAANRPLPWKSKPQQQDAQDSVTGCDRDTAQHLN